MSYIPCVFLCVCVCGPVYVCVRVGVCMCCVSWKLLHLSHLVGPFRLINLLNTPCPHQALELWLRLYLGGLSVDQTIIKLVNHYLKGVLQAPVYPGKADWSYSHTWHTATHIHTLYCHFQLYIHAWSGFLSDWKSEASLKSTGTLFCDSEYIYIYI